MTAIFNYLVLDIENNNSKKFKRSAGHFLYDEIVAIGLKYADYGLNEQDTGRANGLLGIYSCNLPTNTFSCVKLLIGHNIKHDLLFLWRDKQLQDWLRNGGKIWDTQLVEYILTSQQSQYAALRDIAITKYMCADREKLMEKYWETGTKTSDIPMEIVLEDVKNDVLDTEQIFLQQYEQVKARGLLPLIESEMDALLGTCEIEFNGMYINKDIMYANWDKLEKEQQSLLNEIKQKFGDININSGDQLSKLLFSMTKPNHEWHRDKKPGFYKVDEEVLNEVLKREEKQEVRELCNYAIRNRALLKLISTYYKSTHALISDDSCVHAQFNHVSTDTGRLSCKAPNIQNQPNNQVLEHFTSR